MINLERFNSAYVGIDPGTKTGIAFYENGALEIGTTDFWGGFWLCYNNKSKIKEIHIEVPRTKVNWHKSKSGITSANVGGIYREANLLFDGLVDAGFKVYKHHPQGKIDSSTFNTLTKYKGRTNEHVRDAAMLVFGR